MRPVQPDPGALRHELALLAPAPSDDGLGGAEVAWVTLAVIHAAIEPLGVRLHAAAGQDFEPRTHRMTLRARAGIAAGMRFAKGTRRFRIVSVRDPDESGRFLVCDTEELS